MLSRVSYGGEYITSGVLGEEEVEEKGRGIVLAIQISFIYKCDFFYSYLIPT
jgi:hypothetical protein